MWASRSSRYRGYEATDYATAKWSRIREVADALSMGTVAQVSQRKPTVRDIHFDSRSRTDNPSIAKCQSVNPPTWDTLAPPFMTLGPSVVLFCQTRTGYGCCCQAPT